MACRTCTRQIVDFFSTEDHLVIEVDGEIHDYTRDEDALRQQFIESRGLRVLRFTNTQVLDDLPTVLTVLRDPLDSPSPLPGERAGG